MTEARDGCEAPGRHSTVGLANAAEVRVAAFQMDMYLARPKGEGLLVDFEMALSLLPLLLLPTAHQHRHERSSSCLNKQAGIRQSGPDVIARKSVQDFIL